MSTPPDFRRLKSRADVLRSLGVSDDQFDAVADFDPGADAIRRDESEVGAAWITAYFPVFHRHDIPKRNPNRGVRTVWESALDLKPAYKKLAMWLNVVFRAHLNGYPHDAAFGFMVGRNILENAARHSGRRHLMVADIENFFGTITIAQITSLLRSVGFAEEAAETIGAFVTIGGVLPAGLPTSPVLSNAVLLPMDCDLADLAASRGWIYSRYADDLAFSANDEALDIEEVRAVVEADAFRLAKSKTRRSRIGQAHFVTGLSVSDPVRPHVPRRAKRKLRQELYFASKWGLADHLESKGIRDRQTAQIEINRLDGMVKFVSHHEPSLGSMLKRNWRNILQQDGRRPSFEPRNQHRKPFAIFVDEAQFERGGRPILALAMAATQNPAVIFDEGGRVLHDYLSDPHADGHHGVIEKKGLHFADAPIDLRKAFAGAMATLPFEGYVAFTEYEGAEDYEATYIALLEAMLPRRLMAAESQKASFVFEENDKVSRKAIESSVMAAYVALRSRRDRHPAEISISFAPKPHLGIALADFLLGVLNKYLPSVSPKSGKPEPLERHMFERLRDRYRVILDVSGGREYSRRRPITPWDT